jgi:hypothetical protein
MQATGLSDKVKESQRWEIWRRNFGSEQETVPAILPRRTLIGRNNFVLSNDAFEKCSRSRTNGQDFTWLGQSVSGLSASLDLWLAQENNIVTKSTRKLKPLARSTNRRTDQAKPHLTRASTSDHLGPKQVDSGALWTVNIAVAWSFSAENHGVRDVPYAMHELSFCPAYSGVQGTMHLLRKFLEDQLSLSQSIL